MSILSLDFLRPVFGPRLIDFSIDKIKNSAGPAVVYQVNLQYERGHSGIPSAILKTIAPHWPDDPFAPDRELQIYRDLLPQTGLRTASLFYTGVEPATGLRLIVLEDLGEQYRFPPPAYRWLPEEVDRFLRTYACLHVRGRESLPPAPERAWLLTYQQPDWQAETVLQELAGLIARGIFRPLPGAERLVDRALGLLGAFAAWPATLLHGDLYPPNIGLPVCPEKEAVLIDWEMAGWGLAEFDLAYLFMQPYGSARQIDVQKTLDVYWSYRQALEGVIPPAEERRAAQWFAEAMFALAEVFVARRVAEHPFPAGTAPHAYWQAMYGVLERKLNDLCASL
jgi:hypothetical protein